MDDRFRTALVEIAGEPSVGAASVTPASTDQLAEIFRLASEHGVPLSLTSAPVAAAGATRGTGRRSSRAQAEPGPSSRLLVSLSRFDSVDVDVGAMVLRAGAGARVEAVRAAAGSANAELLAGISAASAPEHAGSLVARGALPRRGLTGIEAVLTTGEAVRAGGKAHRDVTGYDLCSVFLGSGGRLGAITAITFRLQPKGARGEVHEAGGEVSPSPLSGLLAAAFDPRGLLAAG